MGGQEHEKGQLDMSLGWDMSLGGDSSTGACGGHEYDKGQGLGVQEFGRMKPGGDRSLGV